MADADAGVEASLVQANAPQQALAVVTAPTDAARFKVIVDVVFGLNILSSAAPLVGEPAISRSWEFDIFFDARQPWAQRNMQAYCNELPALLSVVESRCWIEDFRKFVLAKSPGAKFPVHATIFDEMLMEFATTGLTGTSSSQDFMWIRGGDIKEVRATYLSFTIDLSSQADVEVVVKHMDRWDEYTDKYNDGASRFARGAWHTSSMWVRAEAHKLLFPNLLGTWGLVLLIGGICVLLLSQSVLLSIYVVFMATGSIASLFWLIVVPLGRAIGPVETIVLVAYSCMALLYPTRIALEYAAFQEQEERGPQKDETFQEQTEEDHSRLEQETQKRYQRALFALNSLACSTLGGGFTTATCSLPLLLSSLNILQRWSGAFILAVLLALFVATVPTILILLLIGPKEPGCRRLPNQHDLNSMIKAFEEFPSRVKEATAAAPANIKKASPAMPKMPSTPRLLSSAPSPMPPPPPMPSAPITILNDVQHAPAPVARAGMGGFTGQVPSTSTTPAGTLPGGRNRLVQAAAQAAYAANQPSYGRHVQTLNSRYPELDIAQETLAGPIHASSGLVSPRPKGWAPLRSPDFHAGAQQRSASQPLPGHASSAQVKSRRTKERAPSPPERQPYQ
jgi:hypothetical protein